VTKYLTDRQTWQTLLFLLGQDKIKLVL